MTSQTQTKTLDPDAIGRKLTVMGVDTYFHDAGDGPPLLLLHGSGPGVSAWSNWRPVYPVLSERFRVIAPDQIGFNRSQADGTVDYGRKLWTDHALALMDELGFDRFSVIGNSMGGAIALSLAAARPEAIDRIVAMGTMGIGGPIPDGLAEVWGYDPSPEAMRRLIELFAYDQSIVTDELVQMRYQASAEPIVRDAFAAMFPEPRQHGLDDLALSAEELRAIEHPVLLAHGYHDRIVPLASTSLPLMDVLPDAQLHAFGNSGHWVMIEQAQAFATTVLAFLQEGD
ncbi:MAG: alpha/beta fold hydrolase [Solirubrobacterales bacterium]